MFYVMFLRERAGTDSPASRGDMVITREISTGYIKALKWFLSDDGKSFLLLSPKNEKTLVDYVVGGALVRSGISVNTLLYYFIIRDFSFLYDALKSSINWNLVFVQAAMPAVEPSMAEISAELRSFGTIPESLLPGTKAGLLLRAILDISKVDEYFAGIGKPAAEISELSVIPFTAIAIGLDLRKGGDFAKALPWRQDRGFNIDIIQPLLTLGNGWVYYVLVDSGDGKTAVKLLALVSPGGDGVRHIDFFDAERREFIDLGILIKARPEAHARVFQLSAP